MHSAGNVVSKEIKEEIARVGGKSVGDVASHIDNIFKGARQRAIAKFGKEAEDLISIKLIKMEVLPQKL